MLKFMYNKLLGPWLAKLNSRSIPGALKFQDGFPGGRKFQHYSRSFPGGSKLKHFSRNVRTLNCIGLYLYGLQNVLAKLENINFYVIFTTNKFRITLELVKNFNW
jgi:hypothetical protein